MKNLQRLKSIYEQYKLNQMQNDYNNPLIYFLLLLCNYHGQRTVLKFCSKYFNVLFIKFINWTKEKRARLR